MSPSERVRALAAWIVGPRGVMAFAVSLLFVLMVVSFADIPWDSPPDRCGGTLCEIPVTPPPSGESIAEALFGDYPVLVILSALVLAACMIGGVYLAKTEGPGP